MLVGDLGEEGEMLAAIVLMLSVRLIVLGEAGLVGAVYQLLLLEVLPLEDPEEPLVLELSLRSLLKAPRLETGGLEAREKGACASLVSGAAYWYASVLFTFLPRWNVRRLPTSANAMRLEWSIRMLDGRIAVWAAPRW